MPKPGAKIVMMKIKRGMIIITGVFIFLVCVLSSSVQDNIYGGENGTANQV